MEAAFYATAGLLIVATVSGLSFLAVQFPKTFKNFYWVGTVTGTLGIIALSVYDLGVRIGGKSATEFVIPAKIAAATAARLAVYAPFWAYVACIFTNFILLVLNFVSERIEREKEEVERRRKQRE
jgi:hypothetical protein